MSEEKTEPTEEKPKKPIVKIIIAVVGVVLLIVLAFVLVSYSPPEVLFFLFVLYGLSGYANWLMLRFKNKTPL